VVSELSYVRYFGKIFVHAHSLAFCTLLVITVVVVVVVQIHYAYAFDQLIGSAYSIIGSRSGFTVNLGSDSLGKSND